MNLIASATAAQPVKAESWRKGCPVNLIETAHVLAIRSTKATVSTTQEQGTKSGFEPTADWV